MKLTRFAKSSPRTELFDVVGTIVIMLLSSVCVVVLCAAANKASQSAAKIVYAAPAASAPGDGAGAGMASIQPR